MIGKVIHNYRFDKLLGEGGMGVVYKATELTLQRIVAIKILHTHLINDSVFFDRFKNEAILLAQLSHPNVTTLFNFFSEGGQSFMVMEYVQGKTLEDYLKDNKELSAEFLVNSIASALDGLAHAHEKGILHRDIKPSNLMISSNGTVKLMDFGIAKMKGSTSLTRIGSIIGTLEYMAPELLAGKDPSIQSDLYAIGVVLFEMLIGSLPFEANTEGALINNIINKRPAPISSFRMGVPRKLDQIIATLLHKKPEKRFANALDLKKKLEEIVWVKNKAVKPVYSLGNIKQMFGGIAIPKGKSKFQTEKSLIQKLLTPEGYMIIGGVIIALLVVLLGTMNFKPKQNIGSNIEFSEVIADASELTNIEEEQVFTGSGSNIEDMTPFQPDNPLPSAPPPSDRERKAPAKPVEKPVEKEEPAPKEQEIRKDPPVAKETPKPEPEKGVMKNIYVSNLSVELALNMDVSSDDPQIKNKKILFRVVYDITKDGVKIIPAGSVAEGRVVKVKPSTASGKPFLEIRPETVTAVNGVKLKLSSPSFGMSGSSSSKPLIFTSGTKISPNPKIADNYLNIRI